MLHSWLRAVRALMLGLWAGGMLMTFLSANIIFAQLKNDTGGEVKAGNIVGDILKVGGKVKMGLGLTALALEAVIFYGGASASIRGWRRYAPAGLLMAALSLALLSSLWLEPKVHELRGQPEFGKYHGMSMGLALLEMLLVVVTLVVGLL